MDKLVKEFELRVPCFLNITLKLFRIESEFFKRKYVRIVPIVTDYFSEYFTKNIQTHSRRFNKIGEMSILAAARVNTTMNR